MDTEVEYDLKDRLPDLTDTEYIDELEGQVISLTRRLNVRTKEVELRDAMLKLQDGILAKLAETLSLRAFLGGLTEGELQEMEDMVEPYKTV